MSAKLRLRGVLTPKDVNKVLVFSLDWKNRLESSIFLNFYLYTLAIYVPLDSIFVNFLALLASTC